MAYTRFRGFGIHLQINFHTGAKAARNQSLFYPLFKVKKAKSFLWRTDEEVELYRPGSDVGAYGAESGECSSQACPPSADEQEHERAVSGINETGG
jgi:hypothetical protein